MDLQKIKFWFKASWWGHLIVFVGLLGVVFGGTWTVFEVGGAPEKFSNQADFFTHRFFIITIISYFTSSLIVLVLVSVWRHKEWNQSRRVHFGDKVRLKHFVTGKALHSHNQNYSHQNSSGQQQITCFDGYDSNDIWVIKPRHGVQLKDKIGKEVLNDEVIRLEHLNTSRNLHSHQGVPSPITKQQEVTAYGKDGVGDTNDNWQIKTFNTAFMLNERIRLIHMTTKVSLHSHTSPPHPVFTADQQEVTGYADRDENDFWLAESVE